MLLLFLPPPVCLALESIFDVWVEEVLSLELDAALSLLLLLEALTAFPWFWERVSFGTIVGTPSLAN